jgi:CheY-like chemotaxis protein
LALAPTPPVHLIADPTRLRQVLINLLGNAVKFTPAGAIEVRLFDMEAEDCVRLEVADTGPGILAIHQANLFGMFERLNAAAVSGIEGTGLGLAIAARLVRLMGGRIGQTDNPGGGSVFWVELPRGAVAPAAVEAVDPADLPAQPRLLVLVVDDEVLNRNIASGFLRAAGHAVVCVDSGPAAVTAAAAEDFDVILMDVRMHGMNGLEATRLIRALPGRRGEVRIVAVTAQAFAQQIEICRQGGMDGHVSKPFKQSVLLAALVPIRTAPKPMQRPAMPRFSTPADPAPAKPEPVEPGHADPGPADQGSEFPILDREVFEEIAGYLLASQMSDDLQTLITRCEAMLSGLRMTGTIPHAGDLGEAAHKLAGGAGTFGFMLVAAAARQYEVAADGNTQKATALGDSLATAIDASLPIVRQELAAMAPNTM